MVDFLFCCRHNYTFRLQLFNYKNKKKSYSINIKQSAKKSYKMKILYIGNTHTYQLYKKGKNPSHWLYGAVEMEKDGHQVIWEKETSNLFNDIKLTYRYKPDLIFIPNLNIRNHLLLLFLKRIGFIKKDIIAYLHHTPKSGKISIIYSFLLKALNHCFFLSKKTMKETIQGGYINKNQCSEPGWGADIDFYNKIPKSDGDYFISTGKENRDFELLIDVFGEAKVPLKIITCKSHAGNDYTNLKEKCNSLSNIEVIITENTGDVYPMMVKEMANAKAIVCPLKQNQLNYCVGLSTIVDAEGLNKPLIITYNSYHSNERIKNFNIAIDKQDWLHAIFCLKQSNKILDSSIQKCYQNMKPFITKYGK